MSKPEDFARWLSARMKEKGFNQTELAERADVTRQYVSRLMNAKPHLGGKPSRPEPETVDKLAKALGVPVDEARLAAGYAPVETREFDGRIQNEEFSLLAQDYERLNRLASDDQRAELRGMVRMMRNEFDRRLRSLSLNHLPDPHPPAEPPAAFVRPRSKPQGKLKK